MLEHLGHAEAAQAVVKAVERVVEGGKVLTRDLGGTSTTAEVGQAIAAMVGAP
jgi:tartrate dehydrogenase/decarboxylase / D-malate dehydrogenase